jgi:signal transduction histidine kinase
VFIDDLKRDGQWTGELYRTGRDGKEIVFESRMVVVKGDGSEQLVLETDHPITERKRMEEALRERARELTDADLRKNEYLALLAHELRNPLASIGNSIQVLQSPNAEPAATQRALELMERQLRGLARMIEDLIDVEGVTRGKVRLKLEPLDLDQIAARAASQCEDVFVRRKQSLTTAIPREPVWVLADPVRLEQVISNLLHNASKFSPVGGNARLSVSREKGQQGADGRELAVIRVEDDGAGIAPEMLPRIFELFVQSSHGADQSLGGLGIGLTLVQRLVELHGGTVQVDSAGRGQGAEFTVELPGIAVGAGDAALPVPPPVLASASLRAAASSSPPAIQPLRILVVEDNSDIRETLRDLLVMCGHEVDVAEDGEQGVEMVLSKKPQVALIDIGLPGLDGYHVARALRARMPGRETRLIALTGYGQPDDRRKALDAGFDAHLVKPVDLEHLSQVLAEKESPS